MPMYEYDCPGCGRLYEKRVPMTEADHTPCPHCGNTHTKRRLSRINVKGQMQNGSSGASLPATGFG